jgi:hypothetical protein
MKDVINFNWFNIAVDDDDGEIPGWDYFFEHLRFYPLPRLILRLAMIAKTITPEYQNIMAQCHDMNQAAEALLNQTTFNYRSDIACNHHVKGDNSFKIDLCCQNIVLRSVYLIVTHFVKPFKLNKLDGHNIEKFVERSRAARERAAKATAGPSTTNNPETRNRDATVNPEPEPEVSNNIFFGKIQFQNDQFMISLLFEEF